MDEKKIKVIVLSDTHGELLDIKEKFDLMLICGDVCPAHDHYYSFQEEWIKNDYRDWINSLPFNDDNSKVVMIGGNHDFFLERAKKQDIERLTQKTNNRLVMLKNELYEFEGLKIFGTPYCKRFGNWAFNLSDDALRTKYAQCPENVDIIISHDSPTINGLGEITKGWKFGKNVGNVVLDELIERVKPKWFFSGHIHSGNHEISEYGVTKMANVSIKDEDYIPIYQPLMIEVYKESATS